MEVIAVKHGGDLLSYKDSYEGELIDFSSNINPLGLPKGLDELIMSSLKEIEAYPDIKYRKLKKSVGSYLGCDMDNVLVGNGAVDLIDGFTKLAKRVLITRPSFAEYEERALVHGKLVKSIVYKDDFTIDIKSIEEVLEKDDLLILGNPNNPTGLRIDENVLIKIYQLVLSKQAYLLLDEAFFEFVPKDYDSIELFKKYNYKNIGIIRAATKFFALPGLRLGYGCTSEELKEKVESFQMPWSVNCIADVAGQYIFDQKYYIEASKKYIDEERNFLLEGLANISSIKPYKTHTNYILIKLLDLDEEYVFNFLLKRGIIVRKCSSFKTLSSSHIRVAIKDRKNNMKLIRGLIDLHEGRGLNEE